MRTPATVMSFGAFLFSLAAEIEPRSSKTQPGPSPPVPALRGEPGHAGYDKVPLPLMLYRGGPRAPLLSQATTLITGKVVDRSRKGVSGVWVMARRDAGGSSQIQAAITSSNGSFRLTDLTSEPYNILSSSEGTFAFVRGVRPGGQAVTLTLAPGGKALVRVRTAEGAPVPDAQVRLLTVAGAPAADLVAAASTDEAGQAELVLPAGAVELEVRKGDDQTREGIQVPAGGTVPADVVLAYSTAQTTPP